MSKISITTLMARCEFILSRFLIDENNLGKALHFLINSNIFFACHSLISGYLLAGNRPIPTARLEEIIFTLQELYRLSIHPEVASVLPLQPYLKNVLREDNRDTRAHLLVLFPSLCEIVLSR